jgi:tyrosine-protein phosphatase YwqE
MFNIFKHKKQNTQLFYATDVHCHILPGVDHGSQSVEQSLEMLRAEREMGITRVVLTSHVTAETFENTPDTLRPAFELLKQAVADTEDLCHMQLFLSAEYRMDEFWDKQYAMGNQIAMPGNYILMENSFHQELLGLDDLLFDLRVRGYKPILAHPERYAYYAVRKQRMEQLHGMGIKFQVNLLSLAGYFGQHCRETALWLVKNGMVDMLGSDMHGLDHAKVIQDFLNTKEWRNKIAPQLQTHIINDLVSD